MPSLRTSVDSYDALKAHVAAEHPVAPTALETMKLTINGELYEFVIGGEVKPWHVLAYTLRETLGLAGTKIGCDDGSCGICTVLMDGKPILSCHTLTAECDGKNITTIEGLEDVKASKLHPIQQAFIEEFGVQCGFCTPGQIMAAKSLLDRNPNPSREEVREALSGVLCRCTGYDAIIDSVLAAARIMEEVG